MKAIQSYSNETTTLRFLGTLNDISNHNQIIAAGDYIISYSNEGIRLISLNGVAQ